jgi:transcriptional regulator with XRE-family HTH domain
VAGTTTKRVIAPDSLGARVRAARLERGLSQSQLAGEDLTKGFISQLESGIVRPSVRSLQIIASRLGKSLDYFLGDEPLSLRKRVEFFQLAAQAAYERRAWDELRSLAEEALELPLEASDRAHFIRWMAHARLGLDDNEGAFAAADEVLRALRAEESATDVAWALFVQGVAYANIGQIVASAQSF